MEEITPPANGDKIRELVDARLAEAEKQSGPHETVRVAWRERPRDLLVIDMPTATLYYNPDTHRIRAQRGLEPVSDESLSVSPWSDASQEYLHRLLRAKPDAPNRIDPEFLGLQDDLGQHGQRYPGIITRSGITVNGNTRLAALRELGQENIRVGVLPGDCSWEDIRSVELELQLHKEHRRDYTYVNRLIAIDEEIQKGKLYRDVASAFRTNTKVVQREVWVLSLIRNAIDRSRTLLSDGATSASMRLIDFENDAEKLKELYRDYTAVAEQNREQAELLKESRLLGLVLGFAKTKIRFIGSDFHTKHLGDKLAPALGPLDVPETPETVQIPGLDLTVPGDDPTIAQAKAATDKVLRSNAVAASHDARSPHEYSQSAKLLADVSEVVGRTLDAAERQARARKNQQAAVERISDATEILNECVEAIAIARSKNLLDDELLDDAFTSLRGALKRLAQQASRGVESPGEGLTWLQQAVREED